MGLNQNKLNLDMILARHFFLHLQSDAITRKSMHLVQKIVCNSSTIMYWLCHRCLAFELRIVTPCKNLVYPIKLNFPSELLIQSLTAE